jgi:hypothetical protein
LIAGILEARRIFGVGEIAQLDEDARRVILQEHAERSRARPAPHAQQSCAQLTGDEAGKLLRK